jgi:hypothetical protein
MTRSTAANAWHSRAKWRAKLGPALLVAAYAVIAQRGIADEPPSADTTAVAQRLFDDGKAAMAEQRYAEACKRFAESHRLDPATGGTLLNLAVCNESLGKIATAWAEFEEAELFARHYGRPDREKLARERIAALRPRVSMLLVQEPLAWVAGLSLTVDGVAMGRAAWGGIPIDPGDHVVTVSAPGKLPWTSHVAVGTMRMSPTLAIPLLNDAPEASQPLPLPGRAPVGQKESTGSARPAGFLLAGVGVPLIGVGAVFGLAAIHANSESKANCSRPGTCPPDVEGSRALLDANLSNVAIGVGVAAVVLGTVLVLLSPHKSSPPRAGSRSVRAMSWLSGGERSVGVGGAW